MRTEPAMPWPVPLGIVILAASLVPIWLIDLQHAPVETRIRLWTTVAMAAALFAIARKVPLVRWLLLIVLGTGIAVSGWSFVEARTIELESALITLAQVIGLGLFFTPSANAWFRSDRRDLAS